MKNNENFLGTEKISKLFLKLVIPTVIAQIVNLLYNVVDRIYIGHIADIGSLALTGVGVCMPITIILGAFAQLIGYGGAPRTSMFLGKNDLITAEKILGCCTTFLIVSSVLITISFRSISQPLLILFGASENTFPYALEYINIYILGSIFIFISVGLNMFITSQGYTKISMMTVVIGGLLNIILDPIFIFYFNLGIKGAAIATVLSQAMASIWCIGFLVSKNSILKIKLKNLIIKKSLLLPCILLGLSPFIMQITECIVSICFNRSLAQYGGDIAVGSITILSTIMQFVILPLHGFAQGAQPIVSYNWGGEKIYRVLDTIKLLVKVSLLYSFILWTLIMLFPETFIGIFTDNTELIAYSVRSIRIFVAMLFIIGAQIACQVMFIALGNAKVSIFLALLRKIFLLTPLIYLLPNFFENKAMSVFLAEPVADTLATISTITLFIISFKKTIKVEKLEDNIFINRTCEKTL